MNDNGYYSQGRRRRSATANLKRCPLCGALNADENAQCFVCTWHGEFSYDEELICEALEHLIDRCPELAMEFAEPTPSRWQVWRKQAATWIVAMFVRP